MGGAQQSEERVAMPWFGAPGAYQFPFDASRLVLSLEASGSRTGLSR
jgi:hypothetical protein